MTQFSINLITGLIIFLVESEQLNGTVKGLASGLKWITLGNIILCLDYQ